MFKRRKSLISVSRELHRLLNEAGTEAITEWWSRAEADMKTAHVSSVSVCLMMAGTISAFERSPEAGAQITAMIRAGYALRMTAHEVEPAGINEPIYFVGVDMERLARLAELPTANPLGCLELEHIEANRDQLEAATAFVATACESPTFHDMIRVEPAFWAAVVSLADYSFQKNFGPGVTRNLTESSLRQGYLLRALDERLEADEYNRRPDGTVLDVESWIGESTGVALSRFEPFVESSLEAAAIEFLGIQTVVARYTGTPWQPDGEDSWLDATVANARFGFAMRNRETQLIDSYGKVMEGDPLASLASGRGGCDGLPGPTAHRIIREVIRDSPTELYELTPGTTSELRKAALHCWIDQQFRGDPEQLMAIEHGYFFHRLIELAPAYLDLV